MSVFASYQASTLLQATVNQQNRLASQDSTPVTSNKGLQKLQNLAVTFSKPLPTSSLQESVAKLVEQTQNSADSNFTDPVEQELVWAAVTRALVGVYSEVMGTMLEQATQAENEAEWWGGVERIGGGTAWYLLQTLPHMITRLGHNMLTTLRSHGEPITLQTFTPRSMDRLFPPRLLSHLLTHSFFPHLSNLAASNHPLFSNPIELARQECRSRRLELEKLRDDRAERLGKLAGLKSFIEAAITGDPSLKDNHDQVLEIASYLQAALSNDFTSVAIPPTPPQFVMQPRSDGDGAKGPSSVADIRATAQSTAEQLHQLLSKNIPAHASKHEQTMEGLLRPSRITRLWPRLVLGPPIAVLMFRMTFGTKDNFVQSAYEAGETIRAFWVGWVIEPIKSILNTVRSGGDDAIRVVSKDGLKSDMESLERMVLSLATEKLGYDQAQLEALSNQIRQGDLTSILKIYEEDMKSPVKNAITGSLIRSLLIQVQKTKVDVDLALSGIDKLLKSQELTFGFVGVAPSLAVVYLSAGWLRKVLGGGRGAGRYGGVSNREGVWVAMRRIERLLNSPTSSSTAEGEEDSARVPLTEGLLLLSINHLRIYALTYLPRRSRLQDGFLEDIDDLRGLKTPADRLKVVERMWRSWGPLLGWTTVPEESGQIKMA